MCFRWRHGQLVPHWDTLGFFVLLVWGWGFGVSFNLRRVRWILVRVAGRRSGGACKVCGVGAAAARNAHHHQVPAGALCVHCKQGVVDVLLLFPRGLSTSCWHYHDVCLHVDSLLARSCTLLYWRRVGRLSILVFMCGLPSGTKNAKVYRWIEHSKRQTAPANKNRVAGSSSSA